MSVLESEEEWSRRQDLQAYSLASPLGRFWINYWRKRHGEPPLRARQARAELAEIRARLKAREAAWRARERALWL